MFQARAYGGDVCGGDMTLLNHQGHPIKDDSNYNMILLNNIMHNDRNSPSRRGVGSRATSRHHMMGMEVPEPAEYTDSNSILCELLAHVKQINEELHIRQVDKESDDHFKSEWRIIFFVMTCFTCIIIFVNVPHDT